MNELLINNQDPKIKKQSIFLNRFWLGFIIYSFGGVIAASSILSIKLCQAIQALGLVLIVTSVTNLVQSKIENGYLKIVFTFYIIWLISIVLRGVTLPLDYNYVKGFLFGGGNALIYFIPLILLLPKNFPFYKKVFDVLILFGILYLLLDIVFIKKLLASGKDEISQAIAENLFTLSIPSGFILLTWVYHSKIRNLFAVGIILLTLLFSIIRARRGLIFITSGVIITSYLLFLFNSKKKNTIIYFSILAMLLGALYFNSIYNVSNNRLFGFLADRGTEDTRSGVELYFYDDMKTVDWIIGRGISGEYYCPDIDEDQITDYRSAIETGYLQIILKGGLISLGLFFLITIPASLKGIFFSKNSLSKGAGIWIFLFMINLYPQDAVSVDLSYLLLWIAVGICFSKNLRKMTDREIVEHLYPEEPIEGATPAQLMIAKR